METRNKGLWPTKQKYDTAELMLKVAGWEFIGKEKEFWYKSPAAKFFVKSKQLRNATLSRCWYVHFNTNLETVSFDV